MCVCVCVLAYTCVCVCVCLRIHVCSCACEELEFQISTACSVHRQHRAILVNCAVPWRCTISEVKGKTVQILCPNCKFSLER